MSLFDNLVDTAKRKLGAGKAGPEAGVMEFATGLLGDPKTGGLTGLVQKFKDNGLGDIVASWIGTGAKLPISATQIQQVLGAPVVQQFAQKAGVAPDAAAGLLAQWLPVVIDKLTPGGQLPSGDALQQGLAGLKDTFTKH